MDQIDRYRIVALVGENPEGRSFRAFDERLNRTVLLTLLQPRDKTQSDALLSRAREVNSALGMFHPYFVTAHDWGLYNGIPYMVADFVEGQSLADIMSRGTEIAVVERLSYLMQCADGLGYAHSRGLTHGQLNPSNVLVTAKGGIRIMGLGMVGALGEGPRRKMGTLIASLAYTSPEQFEGSPTPLSDIFSFGVIAFELVTGKNPFWSSDNSNVAVVIRNITGGILPPIEQPNPECPALLMEIILRCLKVAPEQRYPSCAEISRLLGTIHSAVETDWIRASLKECESLFNRGMKTEAQNAFRRVQRRAPSNPSVSEVRRKFSEAKQSASMRQRCDRLLRAGQDAMERRDYSRAIDAFEAVLQRDELAIEATIAIEEIHKIQNALKRLDFFLETSLYEAHTRSISNATRTADLLIGGSLDLLTTFRFVYPPAAKITHLIETIVTHSS
jgi:serine/threonine protein kinase